MDIYLDVEGLQDLAGLSVFVLPAPGGLKSEGLDEFLIICSTLVAVAGFLNGQSVLLS